MTYFLIIQSPNTQILAHVTPFITHDTCTTHSLNSHFFITHNIRYFRKKIKLRNSKKGSVVGSNPEAKGEADEEENDTTTGLESGSGLGTGTRASGEGATVRGILGGMVVQEEVFQLQHQL